jgi:large subunit ribosomal protein L30
MQKIKIRQIRSIIDRPVPQKRTIEALGLGRPNWEKIHNDTPQIRGMINKIPHLVEVSEYKPTGEEKETVKTSPKKKAPAKKASLKTKTKKAATKTKKESKSE